MRTRVNGVDIDAGGGAALSNATPQPPGTPAAGTGTEASRDDHVHDRELPSPIALADGDVAVVASGAWTAAPPVFSDATLSTASATGWTTRDGSGTAAITAGVARLTLGLGVVPGAFANVPLAARAHGLDPWNVDVRGRIAAWTGGNSSNVFVSFGLRRGTAGNDGIFFNLQGDNSGGTSFYREMGGSAMITAVSLSRAALTAGTFWVRLSIRGGFLSAFHGVGVGTAEPADWTCFSGSSPVVVTPGSYVSQVVMGLDAINAGSPDAVTVDFANIRVQGGAL